MVSRFTFMRSVRFAALLCAIYFLAVSITAVAVYKYHSNNRWTQGIEKIFPYPAAIVNGETISLSRFQKETAAKTIIAQKTKMDVSHEDIEKNVIDQLITRKLYSQTLAKNNIYVKDGDVESALQDIYKTIGGKQNLPTFLQKEYGGKISLADFRLIIKEYLEQSALENKLLVNVTIRHILIAVPEDASDAQVADAKKRAVDAKAKITDISKFSDIAKEYSEDVATRDKGGNLGTSTRGEVAKDFSKKFEDAIFSLPVGKVSDPIRSKHGWELVVVDKKEGTIDKGLKQFTDEKRSEAKVALFVGK